MGAEMGIRSFFRRKNKEDEVTPTVPPVPVKWAEEYIMFYVLVESENNQILEYYLKSFQVLDNGMLELYYYSTIEASLQDREDEESWDVRYFTPGYWTSCWTETKFFHK